MSPISPERTLRNASAALLAITLVVFSAVTVLALRYSDSTIESVSGAFMGQMSSQIRLNFDSELRLYRSEMESVTLSGLTHELRDEDELRAAFAEEAAERGFTYAAVLDSDGAQEVLLGESVSIDDYADFSGAVLAGEERVTAGVTAGGETVVVLAEPVERPMEGGRTSELLAVGVPLGEVIEALSLDVSTTEVYSHIVRANGDFVLNSGRNSADNYLQLLRDSEGVAGVRYDITADELSQVMEERGSRFYVVYVNGSRYASYLAPLPETTWFIVSVLPYSVLQGPIDTLTWSLVGAAFVGCVLLMGLLVFFFSRYLAVYRQMVAEADRAREEADAASRAKSEFLSNMSHDIRTPMNAIVNLTKIAKEHGGDAEAVSGYLDKISASSAYLLGLINDVLDMSRIESGRMELSHEPTLLEEEVLDRAVATMEQQASDHGLELVVQKDLSCGTVLTDEKRLSQVLLNLLSNAVKFTPAGGTVTLRVTQEDSPRGPSLVRTHLWVLDTGIGMSEEFMGKIFDSFEREDSERVRKIEGTGLGMAIVKSIVDAMGGTIEVASKMGEGSTFHVTLDLERAQKGAEAKASLDEADLTGLRVLVAEDNDINWEVASELLGSRGLELDWAKDGRECVELFSASSVGHYGAILMDVRMPEMNGYEATREIRGLDRPDAATVPIVAMTADAFAEDREKAREAGMNAHVAKPIDVREVLRVLARLVGAAEGANAASERGGQGASDR